MKNFFFILDEEKFCGFDMGLCGFWNFGVSNYRGAFAGKVYRKEKGNLC